MLDLHLNSASLGVFEVHFSQNNKKVFLQLLSQLFILKLLKNGQNRKFFKSTKWNMRETPSIMQMHDIVTIDTKVFEIVGGGLLKHPPPPPNRKVSQILRIELG